MNLTRRAEIFQKTKARHTGFLTSVLWKLTGDRELFTEAMQYALLEMWQHVEKLDSEKAGGYIYRIALSANSKAWRNRIGKDGQLGEAEISVPEKSVAAASNGELVHKVRRAIAELPSQQSKAIVMRYLEQQDYEYIGQRLECSESAARSNVSKAVAALKRMLCDE